MGSLVHFIVAHFWGPENPKHDTGQWERDSEFGLGHGEGVDKCWVSSTELSGRFYGVFQVRLWSLHHSAADRIIRSRTRSR